MTSGKGSLRKCVPPQKRRAGRAANVGGRKNQTASWPVQPKGKGEPLMLGEREKRLSEKGGKL